MSESDQSYLHLAGIGSWDVRYARVGSEVVRCEGKSHRFSRPTLVEVEVVNPAGAVSTVVLSEPAELLCDAQVATAAPAMPSPQVFPFLARVVDVAGAPSMLVVGETVAVLGAVRDGHGELWRVALTFAAHSGEDRLGYVLDLPTSCFEVLR